MRPRSAAFLLVAALLAPIALSQAPAGHDPYERARQEMVRTQIEARGIDHGPTLRAMLSVPRHEFVPAGQQRNAYEDRPLPIGHGQTISQPFMVAYMTARLQPKPEDRVLEIGAGSGYQAAILAELVAEVHTIEIVGPLAEQARERLARSGYGNVTVLHGDGYHGVPDAAPFDAIMVTAAAESIPPPLVEQLKDGGRMLIPVGPPFGVQHLYLVTKEGGTMRSESLFPVRFVPLTRERR